MVVQLCILSGKRENPLKYFMFMDCDFTITTVTVWNSVLDQKNVYEQCSYVCTKCIHDSINNKADEYLHKYILMTIKPFES